MKRRCLIISGGDYCDASRAAMEADFVIACDRGYLHARRMGVKPDLIVGDFDSAPVPDTGIPVELAPSRKDDTDTMIAARRALENGCGEAAIACCFGGRLDHALANIQTAAFLAEHGVTVRLIGTDTEGTVFPPGTARFPARKGRSLSVFALSDRCEGVTIRGTKYDVENVVMTNGWPLGVSNLWEAPEAEVSVNKGILLVLQSELKKGEHI